jgi:hypothetical protein
MDGWRLVEERRRRRTVLDLTPLPFLVAQRYASLHHDAHDLRGERKQSRRRGRPSPHHDSWTFGLLPLSLTVTAGYERHREGGLSSGPDRWMGVWSWKREQATMPFQLQTRTNTARTLLSLTCHRNQRGRWRLLSECRERPPNAMPLFCRDITAGCAHTAPAVASIADAAKQLSVGASWGGVPSHARNTMSSPRSLNRHIAWLIRMCVG